MNVLTISLLATSFAFSMNLATVQEDCLVTAQKTITVECQDSFRTLNCSEVLSSENTNFCALGGGKGGDEEQQEQNQEDNSCEGKKAQNKALIQEIRANRLACIQASPRDEDCIARMDDQYEDAKKKHNDLIEDCKVKARKKCQGKNAKNRAECKKVKGYAFDRNTTGSSSKTIKRKANKPRKLDLQKPRTQKTQESKGGKGDF